MKLTKEELEVQIQQIASEALRAGQNGVSNYDARRIHAELVVKRLEYRERFPESQAAIGGLTRRLRVGDVVRSPGGEHQKVTGFYKDRLEDGIVTTVYLEDGAPNLFIAWFHDGTFNQSVTLVESGLVIHPDGFAFHGEVPRV